MGASGWHYFVPYQVDIRQAFDALREDVFRRGDYTGPEVMSPEEKDRMRQINDELRRNIPGIALSDPTDDDSPPQTIEELVRRCGEEGTHSILDMRGVSDEPALANVSPLDDDDLMQVFGLTQPTHDMAISKLRDLLELSDSWVGSVLTIYKGGQPDELLFVGFSGD